MTITDYVTYRILTPAEAGTLVGTKVGDILPNIPSPEEAGDIVRIIDGDTQTIIGLITKLDPWWTTALRQAATTVEMDTVARIRGGMGGGGKTFGWQPKRVANGRESCRAAGSSTQFPAQHQTLTHLAAHLSSTFDELLPDRAAADREVLNQILPEWKMEDDALWTSGVINKTATLPYHRDGMNFPTWSAMPTLRYRMDGGHLHLPEYDIAFPCRDGEVSWFCGKDLVHGVTPMASRAGARMEPYRFSIVYYAMSGMKDCRTYAEETTSSAERRTARERKIAAEATAKFRSTEA
jgi:hypothetical protein